jgi:hypothetical protein
MKKLDKWDCEVIRLFKSCKSLSTVDFKVIWAERCNVEFDYVKLSDIVEHMLKLAVSLNLLTVDNGHKFILSLDSAHNSNYTAGENGYLSHDTKDFNLILLSRLEALFSFTEADKLPGYAEWLREKRGEVC